MALQITDESCTAFKTHTKPRGEQKIDVETIFGLVQIVLYINMNININICMQMCVYTHI